ncbi:MFS transporter [Burkholderia diffusa]|uniref:MFS transporter n=1 Tax=Burkholderia diffusa TaxID=488732 RepID=UPI002AB2ABDD|nr:MFS transporter [Burkholderia diffusa]
MIGGWVRKHFARDATFFMGIYSAGLSVGATVAASASGYIALSFGGWRVAVALWSVLCITAILSWRGLARRFQEAKAVEAQPRQAAQAPAAVGLPWGDIQAWRVAAFFSVLSSHPDRSVRIASAKAEPIQETNRQGTPTTHEPAASAARLCAAPPCAF